VRDAWVFKSGGTFSLHYDAASPQGWPSALLAELTWIAWLRHSVGRSLEG
jgi:hypothetical protein